MCVVIQCFKFYSFHVLLHSRIPLCCYNVLLEFSFPNVVQEDGKKKEWRSKDRFGAKRLRTIADELNADKRGVIEEKSAFRALLNVARLHIFKAHQ